MSKKKRTNKSKIQNFDNNPFKQLKGFAVSESEEIPPPEVEVKPLPEAERSFEDEMDFLGVDRLAEHNEVVNPPVTEVFEPPRPPQSDQTDEEAFLEALGPLDVRFRDHIPGQTKHAAPRRLKQLKQGRIVPEASLDLHGLKRHQVTEKIEHFLQNAVYQQWQTLLIVTGRGLHSTDGEAVLRDEAEKFLAAAGKSTIAEWGRAPRQYGGEGALVVFLKKTTAENE